MPLNCYICIHSVRSTLLNWYDLSKGTFYLWSILRPCSIIKLHSKLYTHSALHKVVRLYGVLICGLMLFDKTIKYIKLSAKLSICSITEKNMLTYLRISWNKILLFLKLLFRTQKYVMCCRKRNLWIFNSIRLIKWNVQSNILSIPRHAVKINVRLLFVLWNESTLRVIFIRILDLLVPTHFIGFVYKNLSRFSLEFGKND